MRYLLIFCIFLCTACANDKSEPKTPITASSTPKVPVIENPATPAEIMQGAWAVQESGTQTGSIPPYWSFNPDGTVTLRMGKNKAQAKWAMSADTKSITYSIGRKKTIYAIEELTRERIILLDARTDRTLTFTRE